MKKQVDSRITEKQRNKTESMLKSLQKRKERSLIYSFKEQSKNVLWIYEAKYLGESTSNKAEKNKIEH